MTNRPKPLVRALRSLPLAIVLGTTASTIGTPFVHWLDLLIGRAPMPPWPVWADYLAIRAVAGACLGAAAYAAVRLPDGWLRTCLYLILFLLLMEGDIQDFARWPLGFWLEIWVVGSLIVGVIFGTAFHALERRQRARQAASRQPGDGF